MKNWGFLLLLFVSVITFGQTDKYTEKLKALYEQTEYEKVIKFKAAKEDQMASKSLYYKGLAGFMSEQDNKAIEYLSKAIDKGPVDYDMYYYRAMTLYYMSQNEKAIADFDKAIALAPPISDFYSGKAYALLELESIDSAMVYFRKATKLENCSPSVFASAGNVSAEMKNYDEAISMYKKAIGLVEIKTDKHQIYNYNLGLSYQQNGDLFEAKTTFRDHINLYPKDYHATAKLIQVKYAMNEWEDTEELKNTLRKGYNSGSLPSYMSKMFCFDQFTHNDQKVLAFESYDYYEDEILKWKHKFLIQDENGDVEYKVVTLLDTIDTETAYQEIYQINLIKNDTLYTYDHYSYTNDSNYNIYKVLVIEVLDGKVEPVYKMGGYNEWYMEEMAKIVVDQGTNAETAIPVNSVPEEYEWLRQYYPGYDFMMQALISENGKYYDVLTFKTAAGVEKSVYFDITSFFGKW